VAGEGRRSEPRTLDQAVEAAVKTTGDDFWRHLTRTAARNLTASASLRGCQGFARQAREEPPLPAISDRDIKSGLHEANLQAGWSTHEFLKQFPAEKLMRGEGRLPGDKVERFADLATLDAVRALSGAVQWLPEARTFIQEIATRCGVPAPPMEDAPSPVDYEALKEHPAMYTKPMTEDEGQEFLGRLAASAAWADKRPKPELLQTDRARESYENAIDRLRELDPS
jgi:hypothetical protein